MSLLSIYVGTTAFSFLVSGLYATGVYQKLKKEGYENKKDDEPVPLVLLHAFTTLFKYCIPVANFAVALSILFKGDKLYEELKKDSIAKGSIYKTNKELPNIESEAITIDLPKELKIPKLAPAPKTPSMEEIRSYLENEKDLLLRSDGTIDEQDQSITNKGKNPELKKEFSFNRLY